MVDQERAPVGSVAEEAARLLDALGGWAASSGYAAAADRREPPDGGTPGASQADPSSQADTSSQPDPARGAGPSGRAPGGGQAGQGDPSLTGGHCQHCGAENGAGRAVVCGLCPVCQGIGLLRSVRPETVDRLADLAGVLAGTLRELAEQRRGTASGPDAPRSRAAGADDAGTRHTDSGHTGSRHRGSRVQDIAVDDETTATS